VSEMVFDSLFNFKTVKRIAYMTSVTNLCNLLVCILMACWWHCPRQKLDVCFIGDYFVEALVNADDIVLLEPSASALRIMLAICDKYADHY